jgi:type II secretory pathway pseudopilin PulG
VALLLVLLAIMLAAGYAGLRGINAAYARADRDARTLAAMQQAKQALLGYAANQVRLAGVRNITEVPGAYDVPGALPCPAATLDYLVGIGASQEYGRAKMSCTTPASRIGRLPWRTLEVPSLVDASGNPLWYAVSGNFYFQAGGFAPARVNLDSTGQIRLQWGGQVVQQRIVAVIIAPGSPLPGQVRQTTADGDDPANYLERYTVAPVGGIDFDFHPGGQTDVAPAYNDLVMTITEEELFDAIDNAVAARLRRDILPLLEQHRLTWGTYPYATGFFDPQTLATGLAVPAGASPGPVFGHLPVALQDTPYQSASQFSGTATMNCAAPFGGALPDAQLACVATSPAAGQTFVIDTVLAKVNAGIFDAPLVGDANGVNVTSVTATSAPGSLDATVRIVGTVSGAPGSFTLNPPIQRLRTGTVAPNRPEKWFDYASWSRFVYYVRCADVATTCLSVEPPAGPAVPGRAVFIVAGRPVVKPDLTVQQRPSSLAPDYLEPPHDTLPTLAFRQNVRGSAFNDRVVVVQ